MNELGTFISTVGYPIAIGCGLAYIVYKLALILITKIILVLDVIVETSKQQTQTNKELVATNTLLVIELKGQISSIDRKLDKVLDNTEVI